jgi:hypothetical protein
MPNRKTAIKTIRASGGYLSYPTDTYLGRFWHTIRLDTPDWLSWLANGHTFAFENQGESFTVRCETRNGRGQFWSAFKKISGRLKKIYIGTSDKVTHARLLEIKALISDAGLYTGKNQKSADN